MVPLVQRSGLYGSLRTARRHLFDDILATVDKAGNTAALACGRGCCVLATLVKELFRAEEAGGGFVLIHCARTIIDRAIRSQGMMAVQEQFENLHRLVDAEGRPSTDRDSGQEPEKTPVPAAEKLADCKSMMSDLEQVEASRLRMLWMSALGNNVQDIADSLLWNPPQRVAEEQGLLDGVRKQVEWERQFTGG